MSQDQPVPFEVAEQVRLLGQRIRLARVRRRMSQDDLANACQIARTTLHRIEAGASGSSIGAIYAILWTLGLLSTARGIADPDADEHGKILDTARQAKRVRRPADKPDENNF
jgi:transcriptional regulator with XRE-family HTH domain